MLLTIPPRCRACLMCVRSSSAPFCAVSCRELTAVPGCGPGDGDRYLIRITGVDRPTAELVAALLVELSYQLQYL